MLCLLIKRRLSKCLAVAGRITFCLAGEPLTLRYCLVLCAENMGIHILWILGRHTEVWIQLAPCNDTDTLLKITQQTCMNTIKIIQCNDNDTRKKYNVKRHHFASSTDSSRPIHKVTMTSFAITLYGQFCRLHVVGQQLQVTRDIRVIPSCWSICFLCFEPNNTNLLPGTTPAY